MHAIAAFGFTADFPTRLTDCLAGHCEIAVHSDPDFFVATLAGVRTPMIAVLDMHPLSRDAILALIQEIREQAPFVPIIGYGALTPDVVDLVSAAGKQGLTDVIIPEVDDTWPKISARLISAHARVIAESLEPDLRVVAWPAMTAFCRYAFANAAFPVTVDSVASRVRVSRQTLARLLSRAGMPGPRWFVSAARALLAIRFLEDPTSDADEVAEALGFASRRALRDVVSFYTDPDFIHERHFGAFAEALEQLRETLSQCASLEMV